MKTIVETLWTHMPRGPLTTEIGSLPYHNVDTAIEHAFQMKIPFLPQIPIRHHREFMLPQALDLLPGLLYDTNGIATLNIDEWHNGTGALQKKLDYAFEMSKSNPYKAFDYFEPLSSTWSSWQPFLWELRERNIRTAKIQIAGPFTCQWGIRFSDQTTSEQHPDITSQILQLVLARSLAMSLKLKSMGITPVIFLDEPALSLLNQTNPRHSLALQELKLVIQSLKKERTLVGLHCCCNTDWKTVLSLDLDILSIDVNISLLSLLDTGKSIHDFLANGGHLSLGVIPTVVDTSENKMSDPKELFQSLLNALEANRSAFPFSTKELLEKTIFTPACGLALHKTEQAHSILHDLLDFINICEEFISSK